MKKRIMDILIVVSLLGGIAFLAYPTVADWWNQMHQSYAIASYMETVEKAEIDYTALKKEAQIYNETLLNRDNRWTFTKAEEQEYRNLLNAAGNGIIGCLIIPKIEVSLPIYHGTEESVLQIAAGHMEGSSLPVGGASTHCVLSAHTGLPSAKLFTNLDQMEEGDTFTMQVLDDTLTYEVDQIVVVEPREMEYLAIEEGKDYCTLLTCTPYGINSHRLLVRGHRIENKVEVVLEASDARKDYSAIISIAAIVGVIAVGIAIGIQKERRVD